MKDKSLLRFLFNIGSSGRYKGKGEFGMSDYITRYVLMNFMIIFGIIILAAFSIINFRNQIYTDAIVCVCMIFVCIVSFFLARTKMPQVIPASIIMSS